MTLADDRELKRAMEWICNDFNNRPHISLKGSTPNEHHAKVSLDVNSLKEKKKAAAEDRKLFNYKNLLF
jgi:hypothetical protein